MFVLFPNVLPDFLATITQPYEAFLNHWREKGKNLNRAWHLSLVWKNLRVLQLNAEDNEGGSTPNELKEFRHLRCLFECNPNSQAIPLASLALLISKKTTNLFRNVVRIVGSSEIAAE